MSYTQTLDRTSAGLVRTITDEMSLRRSLGYNVLCIFMNPFELSVYTVENRKRKVLVDITWNLQLLERR